MTPKPTQFGGGTLRNCGSSAEPRSPNGEFVRTREITVTAASESYRFDTSASADGRNLPDSEHSITPNCARLPRQG